MYKAKPVSFEIAGPTPKMLIPEYGHCSAVGLVPWAKKDVTSSSLQVVMGEAWERILLELQEKFQPAQILCMIHYIM